MQFYSITPLAPITSVTDTEKKSAPQKIGGGIPFANVLDDAMKAFKETQVESQKDGYELAMGISDDLSGAMISSAKATAALELTVELTSRAMSAYKEIMQMQV